jgi:hypothetical protein
MNKSSTGIVNTIVAPLAGWLLLMGGYQLAAALVGGRLTFKPEESYLWRLWLPTVGILTFESGVLIIASLWLICRQLPKRFGVVCGAVLGAALPPLIGLCTGLVEESLGPSLLFRWNAMEGWIWGLMLALPSAVASAIALICMARKGTRV